jgi:hypothetical protein
MPKFDFLSFISCSQAWMPVFVKLWRWWRLAFMELSRWLLMVLFETPNDKCFVCVIGGSHRSALFLLLFYYMCTCFCCIVPWILTLLHCYVELFLNFWPSCVASMHYSSIHDLLTLLRYATLQVLTLLHCYVELFFNFWPSCVASMRSSVHDPLALLCYVAL